MNQHLATNLLFLPLLTALGSLTGCGGGGGGSSGAGGDTTAPTAALTPAANASAIAPSSSITAGFDEDMFASTIHAGSFTLTDSTGSVAATVAYDPMTRVATLTPDNALGLLRSYTATLSSTITDLSGNALATTNAGFTTRDGVWGTAAAIENTSGNASKPAIAMNANGEAIAVWLNPTPFLNDVWANHYSPATGWGTAERIETAAAGQADSPQVAVDPQGNALAVWSEYDGTRYNIWANRYSSGTGWGTAEMIESDNAGSAYLPQIAIDPNGNALAVWYQTDGTEFNIWANRYSSGTGWGSAELIETTSGNASNPKIGVDTNGNALAVWSQYNGNSANDIRANRYSVGSGWGSAESIETLPNTADLDCAIAVAPNGDAVAVWKQAFPSIYHIWANRYRVGSGWGTAEQLETDTSGHAELPQVAINSQGEAIAVWQKFDGTRTNIWATRLTAGGGWGAAQLLETADAGDALNAHIALDVAGNALALWQQHDGTEETVWSNRYRAGTGWDAPVQVQTMNNPGEQPGIAMGGRGNALGVWIQNNVGQLRVYASRFE